MTDTNIESEGECPQCLQHEKTGQQLCDLVAKLEKENKGLASLLNRLQSEVLQHEEAIANYKSLVESLDKYVGILNEELGCAGTIAYDFGWRSKSIEKSLQIRDLIARTRKPLEP